MLLQRLIYTSSPHGIFQRKLPWRVMILCGISFAHVIGNISVGQELTDQLELDIGKLLERTGQCCIILGKDKELAASGVKLDACVLCKIFQKSGPGPKIGAQYGAPFNDEDWNEEKSFSPAVAPCPPESSHGGLNSFGQHLATSDNGEVSLGPFSESNGEHAVNRVCPDKTSPDIPFDSIHIQLLAEIVSCSSMNLLCTAGEDGSLIQLLTGRW